MSDKILLVQVNNKLIYRDGTYELIGWSNIFGYSEWRLAENRFWFRHKDDPHFRVDRFNDEEEELIKAITDATFELEFLEQ